MINTTISWQASKMWVCDASSALNPDSNTLPCAGTSIWKLLSMCWQCVHVLLQPLPCHFTQSSLLNVQGVLWRGFLKQYYETSVRWYKTTADDLHKEELGPACCGWKLCSAFLPSVCPQSTEHVKDPTSIHIMLPPVKNTSSNTFWS